MLFSLLFFSLVGAGAGFIAGLFGIGGGVVIVPALVFSLSHQGVDAAVIIHLAIGTSLATIVVTGASSAFGHWQKGAVSLRLFKQLLPGLVMGAVLGGVIASLIHAQWLELLFGIFMVMLALRMLLARPPEVSDKAASTSVMVTAGTVIGSFSALFGVGGGVLSVPWLMRVGAPMAQAIGTSAACGLPIALTGALTFIVTGYSHQALPAYTSGYLYWPAFLGMAAFSIPCARLGVRVAHYLPPGLLKRLFGLLMLLIGLKLVIDTLT